MHLQENGGNRLMAISSQRAEEGGTISNQSLFPAGEPPWSPHQASLWA